MSNLLSGIKLYICTPFIKWVGGKSKVVNDLFKLMPKEFSDYYELFLGSGAFFYYLNNNGILINKKLHLNDINYNLINVYTQIKTNLDNMLNILHNLKENHNNTFYYEIRKLFNKKIEENVLDANQAAYFIYLNKTSFNGLYRVNQKGFFNVPVGDYKNPAIYVKNNLINVSNILNKVNLSSKNYAKFKKIREKDFIYLDPPYYPLKSSSFTQYNKSTFLDKQQHELKNYLDYIDSKKAYFMLSNSYCDFNLQLYKDYNIKVINVNRVVNSNIKERGKIKEIVVMNY